jgi:hypothetical protein
LNNIGMNFEMVDPETIIDPNWISEYQSNIDHLWRHQLVELNTNSYILGKIWYFPFDLFFTNKPLFWRSVTLSLYESCVLTIYKLISVSRGNKFTIQKYKNDIRKHIKSKFVNQYDIKLKSIGFEGVIRNLEPRIREIRNNRIAHYDKEWNANIDIAKLNKMILSFEELSMLIKEINNLFDLLCFSHRYSVNFMEYSNLVRYPEGSERRTDIEILLDDIAQKSAILNLPEQQHEFWPHYRQNLSKDDIKVLNTYRIKFKLPCV